MDIGWNFRREHLRPEQRSHSVITDGGDQPNVVPSRAAIWYYIREMDYPDIRRNFDTAIQMAEGAALMTATEMEYRILGTAWPRHYNRPIAETMHRHIRAIGLPEWSEADQTLARAVQREAGSSNTDGLALNVDSLSGPSAVRTSGGSDDIGDVSWVVPTVTLRFPSNIPGLPGHNWTDGIAMATPIAHKGATAGAKVLARTALEMFLNPRIVDDAWTYFREVQTKEIQYTPFLTRDDPPPIWLNTAIMAEFRPKLEPFYFDETRYDNYLEQLGIQYPTVR
jgi:aminobenzoyl-glutamate utilization protein B